MTIIITSCAVPQKTNLSECKALCAGERVESFKDETIECRCYIRDLGDKE